MAEETYDLVVVGAGWFGLAAAKACTQMLPLKDFAVFESAESCGGTWSKNRLYPGLKSNNMVGTYEYPDFPMTEEKYGLKPNSHIPGAVLHRYLTDFAHHFGFFDRIRFRTKVDVVEPTGDGSWTLTVTGPEGTQRTVRAAKLVLATGLTSTPNMPVYKGSETFGAPLFHAKDFCREAPNLKDIKNTIVVGGAKSAFDVAYAMVQAGSTVDLVIRDDGHGPVWITPAFVTPFKKRLDQLLLIRWMTFFSPCPWGEQDGYPRIRRFLHGTYFGRLIVDFFWKMLASDVVEANAYDHHPEMKKLKPWNAAFWIGSGLSILNYDSSLFDLVREGKIRVHIGQIDRLEPKKAVLADGTVLSADLMVCSTGWKKESPIKFQGLGPNGFGLDFAADEMEALRTKANDNVLTSTVIPELFITVLGCVRSRWSLSWEPFALPLFPRLRDQPKLRFQQKTAEPLRLYRFMVPSAFVFERTLAFAGAISSVSTSSCATVQGHWIAAYLANGLDRMPSSRQEITDEIMLHTQWGRWRYPCGYGASLPDFVFEGVPYMDMLLRDLGLSNRRKGGWFKELTSPYLPRDFRGLIEEWKASHDAPLK